MREGERGLTCPSAPADSAGAQIFGVVTSTDAGARVEYLAKDVKVPEELTRDLRGVSPARIFRYAGTCVEARCLQFREGECRLGRDIASQLDAVVDAPPPCAIRPTCRWFAESGPAVCRRCPRIVTEAAVNDEQLVALAALPPQAAGHGHGNQGEAMTSPMTI